MRSLLVCVGVLLLTASSRVFGQLVDQNKAPNTASEAISRPLASGSYPDADRRRTLGHRSQFVEQSDRVRSLPRHSSRTAAVSAQVHRPGGTGHGARRRLREHRGRSRHRRRSRRQLRLMPWTSARGSRLRRRRRHSSRQPRCTHLFVLGLKGLWGVVTTAPYGHDGRSINLTEVILRHHGEAQDARDAFERLSPPNRDAVIAFLGSLVIFPPDDTASSLDPADSAAAEFPQFRHGSIKLTVSSTSRRSSSRTLP
jgi:hypothetical protein